jgi:type I restriction enzyme R subunit
MNMYIEALLVQQTTAEHLEQLLGWESVHACNNEDFEQDRQPG